MRRSGLGKNVKTFLFLIVACSSGLSGQVAWGQNLAQSRGPSQSTTGSKAPPQMGRVIVESSAVYEQADFDSPVLAEIKQGEKLQMSNVKFGPFYRVRLSRGKNAGRVGYIAETDVKSNHEIKKIVKDFKSSRALDQRRFRGLSVQWMRFREETMESRPTSPYTLVGGRWLGPDLTEKGDYPLDLGIHLGWTAPAHYEQALGEKASGFMLVPEVLLVSLFPTGKSVVSMFGFGPFLRYSKFDVKTSRNGISTSYSLEDLNLGLVLEVGVGVVFGSFQVRSDLRLYWERLMSTSLQLGLLYEY